MQEKLETLVKSIRSFYKGFSAYKNLKFIALYKKAPEDLELLRILREKFNINLVEPTNSESRSVDAVINLIPFSTKHKSKLKDITPLLKTLVLFDFTNTIESPSNLKEFLIIQGNKILYNRDYLLSQLTAVTPAYNEEKHLRNALLPLLKAGLKTILVNDGSTDKTLQIAKQLKSQYSNLTIVNLKKNSGKLYAMYAGSKHVKTPFILFTDADSKFKFTPIEYGFVQMFYHYPEFMLVFNTTHNFLDVFNTKALSGFRILNTQLVKQLFVPLKNNKKLKTRTSGYLIETFINSFIIRNKITARTCLLNYAQPIKSKKWGVLKGMKEDLKMAMRLVSTPQFLYNVYAQLFFKPLKNCPRVKIQD